MDIYWKENMLNVRIRKKALMVWLLNKMPHAEVPIRVALATAKHVEKNIFMTATNLDEYQKMVTDYIATIPKTRDVAQVAMDVNSPMGGLDRTQPCSYLEGSSDEAFRIRFWTLLETLSWVDAPTRAHIWPTYETLLALIHTHTETINAARQRLQQQPQLSPPNNFVNGLLCIVSRILQPQQPVQQQPMPQQQPLPQQQDGRSDFQNIIHMEVMAFLDQID